MQHTIEIRNVNKFYGKKQALKDVTLTIEQGMFGLLGRNGAGKTTLMKTLATLHGKQSGDITVCGIPVENAMQIRSITGYLPQDFSMYGRMTVYECLDYLGVLSGMKKELRKERISMLIKQVNLTCEKKKKVKSLSGGMKRRLGIAQALLHDPQVLIVDEPTAGLDPEERIRFRNLLCEVAKERIVILSTHIVGDIEASCEKIAIMNKGEILWKGTVNELISQAAGKVYMAEVSRKDIDKVKNKYMVTEIHMQGENVLIKLISEAVPDIKGAAPAEPDAETAYMYCLMAHGCDVNGGDI